jgi:uncharacterized membrane protein YbhN (UPF0104 family)
VTRFLPSAAWARALLLAPLFAATFAALWWRGPEWRTVMDAFDFVAWRWIVAAIALNLVSVLVRSLAWRTVIDQALPPPSPAFIHVFSAFAIGLLGNAVLPGRMGELARVAVLRRRLPRGEGWTATLAGTVFAHRLFDLVPAVLLVFYVLATARIPHWAVTSLLVAAALGMALLAVGLVGARGGRKERELSAVGPIVRLLEMARRGLGVLRAPVPAAIAAFLQCLGWFVQLLAVWAAMRAFDIDAPLHAAGLVLLLMNVATIFPLWPGNIGLLQAAVALPLGSYGVAYSTGFAYGLVLQVVEMSVGVGVGLIFLAREGMSLASLRGMEEEEAARATSPRPAQSVAARARRARRERARVPG